MNHWMPSVWRVGTTRMDAKNLIWVWIMLPQCSTSLGNTLASIKFNKYFLSEIWGLWLFNVVYCMEGNNAHVNVVILADCCGLYPCHCWHLLHYHAFRSSQHGLLTAAYLFWLDTDVLFTTTDYRYALLLMLWSSVKCKHLSAMWPFIFQKNVYFGSS